MLLTSMDTKPMRYFSKYLLVLHRIKSHEQVLNNMWVNKWWHFFVFGWTVPLRIQMFISVLKAPAKVKIPSTSSLYFSPLPAPSFTVGRYIPSLLYPWSQQPLFSAQHVPRRVSQSLFSMYQSCGTSSSPLLNAQYGAGSVHIFILYSSILIFHCALWR